jgi:hypothetical protein
LYIWGGIFKKNTKLLANRRKVIFAQNHFGSSWLENF